MPVKTKARAVTIGRNIIAEINEETKELILTIDLDETGDISSTGKMMLTASSQGWRDVPGTDQQINLTMGVKL